MMHDFFFPKQFWVTNTAVKHPKRWGKYKDLLEGTVEVYGALLLRQVA